MTLREAAQALVDEIDNYRRGPARIFDLVQKAEANLRDALARPDPDRWAEGAEAMRRSTLFSVGAWERQAREMSHPFAADYLRRCGEQLRALALPVPSATTPAPEAKPAESEAWLVYGSTGEYSDRTDWYVCAYVGADAEAKATRHADLAAQRVKAFEALRCPHDEAWTGYCSECPDSYLEREGRLKAWMGDLDPNVERDCTGTDYCALRVEIRTVEPSPVEPEETPSQK